MQRRSLITLIGAVLAVLGLLITWQSVSDRHPLVRLFFSSPLAIADYCETHFAMVAYALAITAFEAATGLLLAVAIAMPSALLVGAFPQLRRLVLPPMVLSQVVPLITLAPMLIVLFGVGLTSKIMMAAIISFFPLFINIATSIRDTPVGLQEMLALYRPRWHYRILRIHLPLSVPPFMAALRVSATLAVIGAIVAEFTGADAGVGKNLFLATRRLEPELMMTSIGSSTLIAGCFYLLVVRLERLLGRWYLGRAA